jgi:16S rRNA (adenine1518-N6/adenine1519-N6)-dimethyltransferase
MLRASLKSLTPDPSGLLAAAGVPPSARAEEIDVAGFCRLARSYEALLGHAGASAPPGTG